MVVMLAATSLTSSAMICFPSPRYRRWSGSAMAASTNYTVGGIFDRMLMCLANAADGLLAEMTPSVVGCHAIGAASANLTLIVLADKAWTARTNRRTS